MARCRMPSSPRGGALAAEPDARVQRREEPVGQGSRSQERVPTRTAVNASLSTAVTLTAARSDAGAPTPERLPSRAASSTFHPSASWRSTAPSRARTCPERDGGGNRGLRERPAGLRTASRPLRASSQRTWPSCPVRGLSIAVPFALEKTLVDCTVHRSGCPRGPH